MSVVNTRTTRCLSLGLLGVASLMPGCQQEMAVQPSMRPYNPSSFYPDGRAARPVVANTIARGHLRTDLALFTGRTSRSARPWAMPAALLGAVAGQNPLGGLASA